MTPRSPLWPAQLDHFRIDTDDPPPLVAFYEGALGMVAAPLDDGTVLMQGPGRRLVIGNGERDCACLRCPANQLCGSIAAVRMRRVSVKIDGAR